MFYDISQNNSGGYYILNDDVAEFLIIEAENNSQANDILYEITESYSEYCPCCGERWGEFYGEGTCRPTIYGKPAQKFLDEDTWYRNATAMVYYLDGRKERIVSKNRDMQ
ncbi:DUF7296 family protein [Tissierella praeacuta]|uniref:DUF7296 family protein n=1 Tax=Tissierella praeacuta TaxID=43131 RepID=UPI003DA298A4